MSSFGYPNETMIIDTNLSKSPTIKFNAKKVHGYEVNISYLDGDDIIEPAWTVDNEFYSVAGLRIELRSRYMY